MRMRSGSFGKKRLALGGARKRKTVSQKVRESESVLAFLSIVFLCVAGCSYIFQTNSIATSGYEVQTYENRLEELRSENRQMKNREAELRSIKNLEDKKGKLCNIDSSDIKYIVTGDTAVAMRK